MVWLARVSTELRQNMATWFDRVTDDREPLLVTRRGGKGNVVILSEAEFAGRQETVHLLSSPKKPRACMRPFTSWTPAKAIRAL